MGKVCRSKTRSIEGRAGKSQPEERTAAHEPATEAHRPQDRPTGLAHTPQHQEAWGVDFLSLCKTSC